MDPVTQAAAIGASKEVADKWGFNALLVIGLLVLVFVGGWKLFALFVSHIKEMEANHLKERDAFNARLDAKAEAHAVERQKHSEAHLAAIAGLSEGVKEIASEVRDLRRDLAGPVLRRGG